MKYSLFSIATCASAESHGRSVPQPPTYLTGTHEFDYQAVADALSNKLDGQFYSQNGSYRWLKVEDCANLPTCYANNPATPYGLTMLPRAPDERSTFPNWCSLVCEDERSATWRLRQDEVVVLVGLTPPKSSYWGFTNYLFTRSHPDGWRPDSTVPKLQRCPTGPGRCEYFASQGDAVNLNSVNISDAAAADLSPFALIISGNSQSSAVVQESLKQVPGMASDAINIQPLPSSLLKMGVSEADDQDEFTNLLRISYPHDTQTSARYFADAPIAVLRLTPLQQAPPSPYPKPHLINRISGVMEHADHVGTYSELKGALDDLQTAVSAKFSSFLHHNEHITSFRSAVPDNGFVCLDKGQTCKGDSRDTYYPVSVDLIHNEIFCQKIYGLCRKAKRALLGEDQNDFMMVMGVNHKATGKGTYSSVSVYDFKKLQGVGAVSDEEMAGSAEVFLGKDHPLAPYLYAFKFARDCQGEPFCFQVESEGPVSVPLSGPLLFIERMYIDPETSVGASPSEVIDPVVAHYV